MKARTTEEWVNIIENKGFKQVKNQVEWLVLRPNDQRKFIGEENYYNIWNALNVIFEKNSKEEKYQELKTYFNFMTSIEKHGFWQFNRWEWKEAYRQAIA